ncbi:hypothetical protein [Flavobacterium filum]|uniref:hypothetical protein n=1 Tax=Flavobacterium filum TaxID=370974 RepID=UPI0023F001D6|nr:hypothetical protein [Flavobacterium filum]
MTYREIIDNLYSKEFLKIIKVLNQSIYATQFNKTEQTFVLHTGFVCQTHKGTAIEILYDFSSEKIIRQPRNENFTTTVPLLSGLRLGATGKYFDVFYPIIFPYISGEDNFPIMVDTKDPKLIFFELVNPYDYLGTNSIVEVYVKGEDEKILQSIEIQYNEKKLKYPFQMRYNEDIFYDGNFFRRYLPQNEYQEEMKDFNRDDEVQSYEDWLRSEFGDDAETAYWNNE